MKNIHIFIQARMSSTRLPGKVLLPIERKSILERLVDRVKKAASNKLIISTSNNPKDTLIIKEAKRLMLLWFAGDEKDCLTRFIDTAKHFKTQVIVRVTADNPFTDCQHIDRAISCMKEKKCDYVGIKNLPVGTAAEVVTLAALKKAASLTTSKIHREHITSYIYTNPKQFALSFITPSHDYLARPNIRLTVDTEEDFKLIKNIYEHIGDSPTLFEIINLLDHNKNLVHINKHIKQKEIDF